jgi:streptomycin 6-kinase
LQFDKQKLYRWAFAQAMLSALWIMENYHEVSRKYIANAEILRSFVV